MKIGLQSVQRNPKDYQDRGNLVLPALSMVTDEADRFPVPPPIPLEAYVPVARKELDGQQGKFIFQLANTGHVLYIDDDGYEITKR